jgi:hypothetical protein
LFRRRDIEQYYLAKAGGDALWQVARLVWRMSWTQRLGTIGILYYGPSTLKAIVNQTEIYWYQHAYFKMFGLAIIVIAGIIALFKLPRLMRWFWSILVGHRGSGGLELPQRRGLAPLLNRSEATSSGGALNVIVLSDHTSDMTQRRAQQRQAEYNAALQNHDNGLATRAERIAQRRDILSTAWQDRRVGAVLFHAGLLGVLYLMPRPAHPVMRGADAEEIKWASGGEGEQRVRVRWEQVFSNRWTLICGYRNRAGEIDQILVGPHGIFAIEVKHINGKVSCNGDAWWRDKYDNYGNLVEQNVRIADRGGRGPSAQINSAADVLEAMLAKGASPVPVTRVVVLSHPKSQIGRLDNLSVHWAGTLDSFTEKHFAGSRQTHIDEATVQRVISRIQNDHARNRRRGAVRSVLKPATTQSELSEC